MPRGDYPIFYGEAGVSWPWAEAFAGGGMQITLAAEIERGINLEVGANIFANIDASLRKFIAINFEAEAHASAGITAQIQAPMNIFREVGVAVRLEAVAEAAAGAELTIGLNAADFIALVKSDSRMNGLPAQLFMVFMDEVSIGAGAYAKAAVAAMAYADLVVAGTLVERGSRKAGFTISAEAGAGVEVGAGFRACANLGITDPRRFIMRSIDLAVDELIIQISELLPNDLEMEKQLLNAFRAPAKIALRNAYEIGHMLSTESIATDTEGGNQLAMRCVQIVLEESQRFLLDTLVSTGLEMFEEMIQASRFGMTDDKWNDIESQREALADQLLAMPENPFDEDTNDTKKTYWITLIYKLVDLVMALPEYDNDLSKLQPIAIVWSSMELLFIGMQRATTMEASGHVIGMTAGSICEAFGDDSFFTTPHDDIKAYINSQLGGRSETEELSPFHLSQFLVQEPVITALTTAFPEVKIYLDIFRNEIGGTYNEFAKILLTNLGSIDTDEQGNVRPDTMNKSLRPLLRGLQGFLSERLEGELVPIIDEYIGDREDLHTYFHEVLLPSLKLTTDVVFDMVINWENEETSAGEVLEETLSSVLMMLVGRSVVVTTDVILSKVQEEIKTQFNELADDDDLLDKVVEIPPLSDAEDIKEIIRDTLIIGGDVFGPLPDQTRVNIRELLYQILAPLPANDQDDFLTQLRTRNAIPNPELVQSLAWELVGIAGDNLYNFVVLVLQRIAEKALLWLEDAIEDIHQMAQEWISNLEEALSIARAQLVLLIQEIAELIEEVEELFDDVVDNLDDLLTDLSSSQRRDAIRDEIADYLVVRVGSVITSNLVYKSLPSSVKTLAKTRAKSIVKASFDNDIVDSIWDAIGHVSGELDDMLDDLRDLSPEEGLVTQITELVLERIENRITDIFGDDPKIDIEFDIGWSVKIPYTNIRISYSKTINLGEIELPLSLIMSKVRWVMTHVDAVEERIMQVADTLRDAFFKELELYRKEEEYNSLNSITNAMDLQIKDSVSYNRDIVVVTPTPGAVYTDNMEMIIELSGVPWSFLGLGDEECQRVFVWLNGVEIPIDTLMIEEHGSMTVSPTEGDNPNILPSLNLTDAVIGSSISGLHRSVSTDTSLPSNRYEPGLLVDHWGIVLPIQIIEPTTKTLAFTGYSSGSSLSTNHLFKKSSFRTSKQPKLKGHWASNSVIKRNVTKNNPYRLNPGHMKDRIDSKIAETSEKISGPGSSRTSSSGKVKSFTIDRSPHAGKIKQKIGRKLSCSEERIMVSTISGQHVRLSKEIALTSLDEGINTLVVAIVDGRGQKIQQAVTFIAAEYRQTGKEEKEPKIPLPNGQKNREKPVPKKKKGKIMARVDTPVGLRVVDKNVVAMSMTNHRNAIGDFKRTLFKRSSDPRDLVIGKETKC